MKIYISGPIKGTTDYEARFQGYIWYINGGKDIKIKNNEVQDE